MSIESIQTELDAAKIETERRRVKMSEADRKVLEAQENLCDAEKLYKDAKSNETFLKEELEREEKKDTWARIHKKSS